MGRIEIKLNDTSYEVASGTTLGDFIAGLDIETQGIAVAKAYEVIPKSAWNETVLEDGMSLMIIHAVSGG